MHGDRWMVQPRSVKVGAEMGGFKNTQYCILSFRLFLCSGTFRREAQTGGRVEIVMRWFLDEDETACLWSGDRCSRTFLVFKSFLSFYMYIFVSSIVRAEIRGDRSKWRRDRLVHRAEMAICRK